MLTIHVEDQEVERYQRQTYGENTASMAAAFAEFVHRKRVMADIEISIQQLESGQGVPLGEAMSQLRQHYE